MLSAVLCTAPRTAPRPICFLSYREAYDAEKQRLQRARTETGPHCPSQCTSLGRWLVPFLPTSFFPNCVWIWRLHRKCVAPSGKLKAVQTPRNAIPIPGKCQSIGRHLEAAVDAVGRVSTDRRPSGLNHPPLQTRLIKQVHGSVQSAKVKKRGKPARSPRLGCLLSY